MLLLPHQPPQLSIHPLKAEQYASSTIDIHVEGRRNSDNHHRCIASEPEKKKKDSNISQSEFTIHGLTIPTSLCLYPTDPQILLCIQDMHITCLCDDNNRFMLCKAASLSNFDRHWILIGTISPRSNPKSLDDRDQQSGEGAKDLPACRSFAPFPSLSFAWLHWSPFPIMM